MPLPRISIQCQATYDAEVDAAHVYLASHDGRIDDGTAVTQRLVDLPGVGEVTLDFDQQGRLLGIEVLTASALLPRAMLDHLTTSDPADNEADHKTDDPADAPDGFAPINLLYGQVAGWLEAHGPHAAPSLDQVAWSPTFTEQSFPPGPPEVEQLWTTGGWVSWLGGPAVAPLPTWPHTAAGLPLVHIMTIALEDLHATSDAAGKATFPLHEEGLPTTGALEVFHDLRTWGWQTGDAHARAWLVRWVPEPDRSHLVAGPDTTALDGYPSAPVCQAGTFLPGWTLPPLADAIGQRSAVFDAAEELAREHARAWCHQRQVSFCGQVDGPTHAYGHGSRSSSAAAEVLTAALPTGDGDRHRLVLEIESDTHLVGWFGDRGHLQVWMRGSDLLARRFEGAWCLVRTD